MPLSSIKTPPHARTSVWQSKPVYLGGHTHRYRVESDIGVQMPPFWHRLNVHGFVEMAHNGRTVPGGQEHENCVPREFTAHVPPFWHGLLEQRSCTMRVHPEGPMPLPVYPAGQMQIGLNAPSMH